MVALSSSVRGWVSVAGDCSGSNSSVPCLDSSEHDAEGSTRCARISRRVGLVRVRWTAEAVGQPALGGTLHTERIETFCAERSI